MVVANSTVVELQDGKEDVSVGLNEQSGLTAAPNQGNDMNTNDADKTKGLYNKFTVTRTDGSSGPGGKHEHCRYFVLDLDHDPHAQAAILAYANSCRDTYPMLAADLDTLLLSNSDTTSCLSRVRFRVDRPWAEYPIGTKAYACNGGWWVRVAGGWKPNTSKDVFPSPGGDAVGECIELPSFYEHHGGGIILSPTTLPETILAYCETPALLQQVRDMFCIGCEVIIHNGYIVAVQKVKSDSAS